MGAIATRKARPILFSGPMIRAIRSGLKTQTRRVITLTSFHPDDTPGYDWCFRGKRAMWSSWRNDEFIERHCPYGVVGDRLWVRETHRFDFDSGSGSLMKDGRYRKESLYRIIYRADGEETPFEWVGYDDENDPYIKLLGQDDSWRPSIFMPREFSRITLEITEVRVERLQAITEDDAASEGVGPGFVPNAAGSTTYVGHRPMFVRLWNEINGKRSGCGWELNPFVWVISFRRVEGQPS